MTNLVLGITSNLGLYLRKSTINVTITSAEKKICRIRINSTIVFTTTNVEYKRKLLFYIII